MGAVYLAKDPVIDRLVALKLMRTGLDFDKLRDRFAGEARAAGRLHHPNIVTIFEYGEHQGEPFIAMEYIEGRTLASLVGRPEVTVQQILALMDGVAAGLFYAHRAGIIHRDIKPVNLMVDSEGIVKILDFGIARASELSLTSAGTQPGTIVGTLNYMAPEQFARGTVDHRADIFSVGAVFYELLSGQPAFPGELPVVLHMIMVEGPKPLAGVRPDLDPAVIAIVNRCLERDLERRYPDLGVMRHDLAAVRQTSSVPDSAGATVVLTPDAGSAAPMAHSPSGESTILVSPSPAKSATAAARAASALALSALSGGRRGWLVALAAVLLAATVGGAYLFNAAGTTPDPASGTETPAATSSPAPVPPGPAGSGEAANTSASATPFPAFERGCKSGDAHSCTEVGMGFRNGRGSARDDARALDYFERGCTGGDLVGCLNVGEFYANGMGGVTRDYARAAALYQRACNGSVMPGCVFLAQFYAGGRGVERDDKRALDLYLKGCNGNNWVACADAGGLLVMPRGPQHDERRAASLFKKACDANYPPACRGLGLLYRDARGVARDPAVALQLFTKACDGGDVSGCRLKAGG
jgi:serine/threonine-protein kinase